MTPRPTPIAYAAVLVGNIKAARSRAGLDQADVVTRMRGLGFDTWHRQTMGKVERSERRVTAEEIIGLALALETTVPRLLEPLTEDEWVQIPSGESLPPGVFTDLIRGRIPGDFTWYKNSPVRMGRAAAALGFEAAWPAAPDPQQPVMMAVVTSPLGVLVARRQDGKPPWTFIGGWSEPGESASDTIVREVKEETGCTVMVGRLIGERVHPDTGRRLIYFAAQPTHGTEIHVGDEAELAEVRWVSLAEADELLPGMFEPVREYLARELGER
jgi:8-oxo-dGTP diphosphatase